MEKLKELREYSLTVAAEPQGHNVKDLGHIVSVVCKINGRKDDKKIGLKVLRNDGAELAYIARQLTDGDLIYVVGVYKEEERSGRTYTNFYAKKIIATACQYLPPAREALADSLRNAARHTRAERARYNTRDVVVGPEFYNFTRYCVDVPPMVRERCGTISGTVRESVCEGWNTSTEYPYKKYSRFVVLAEKDGGAVPVIVVANRQASELEGRVEFGENISASGMYTVEEHGGKNYYIFFAYSAVINGEDVLEETKRVINNLTKNTEQ